MFQKDPILGAFLSVGGDKNNNGCKFKPAQGNDICCN